MERLTFAPLIQHLKEEEEFYTELYKSFAFQKRTLHSNLFTRWLVQCAEPVVKQTYELDAATLPKVFQAYFTTILKVLHHKQGGLLEQELKAILNLGTVLPELIIQSPTKILDALFQAAKHIHKYQKEEVSNWIKFLEVYAPMCMKTEEFLQLGRLCAWLCGMAHLRDKAKEAMTHLPKEMLEKLKVNFPDLQIILQSSWTTSGKPSFQKAIGNFIGYEGVFIQAPVLTKIENHIFATDGKNNYAVFADQYGDVFVEQQVYSAKTIKQQISSVGFPNAAISFQDITSTALQDNTLFLTRASSHHVYVFSV